MRLVLTALLLTTLAAPASAQQVGAPLVLDEQVMNSQPSASATGSALLRQLENPNSPFYTSRGTFTVSGVRSQVIQSAARGVGIRGGYYEEATRINDLLMTTYRHQLASYYSFQPLMLQNGFVVPPAITQIRAVRELSGPNFLYLSSGSYEIVRPARLTTVTPSWMDWLMLPLREVRPPENLTMENSEERSLWQRSVRDGWEIGVREARASFSTSLATLNRDYHGMRLYHQLARQGAVSIPVVDVSNVRWRVTEDGQRAFEGETTLTIQVNSSFRRSR